MVLRLASAYRNGRLEWTAEECRRERIYSASHTPAEAINYILYTLPAAALKPMPEAMVPVSPLERTCIGNRNAATDLYSAIWMRTARPDFPPALRRRSTQLDLLAKKSWPNMLASDEKRLYRQPSKRMHTPLVRPLSWLEHPSRSLLLHHHS